MIVKNYISIHGTILDTNYMKSMSTFVSVLRTSGYGVLVNLKLITKLVLSIRLINPHA